MSIKQISQVETSAPRLLVWSMKLTRADRRRFRSVKRNPSAKNLSLRLAHSR